MNGTVVGLLLSLLLLGLSPFGLKSQQLGWSATNASDFTSTPNKIRLEDRTCLLEAVYAEASGESSIGQQAVANTIYNRVAHPRHPKTVCAVVNQPGQYKRKRYPSSFRVKTFPDVTNGATHFQRKDQPSWFGLKKKIRIGRHTFYG